MDDLWSHLDERQRRLYAAAKARAMGYGGISAISQICGLSRPTITRRINEILSNTKDFMK